MTVGTKTGVDRVAECQRANVIVRSAAHNATFEDLTLSTQKLEFNSVNQVQWNWRDTFLAAASSKIQALRLHSDLLSTLTTVELATCMTRAGSAKCGRRWPAQRRTPRATFLHIIVQLLASSHP